MPSMNGQELIRRIQERSPSTVAVLMTGYMADALPKIPVVRKPFSVAVLVAAVSRALDGAAVGNPPCAPPILNPRWYSPFDATPPASPACCGRRSRAANRPPAAARAPGRSQARPPTAAPYAPQPIVPGGVVVPLYPPDSPFLKPNASANPSIQHEPGGARPHRQHRQHPQSVHRSAYGRARPQHRRGRHSGRRRRPQHLNVGSEAADFVPFFYNYGVNTVILRYRLRRDGYNPQTDEVNDALQAIRMVRAHAKEWHIDPNKIGIMGFSAGAELPPPAAVCSPISIAGTATRATPSPAFLRAPILSG